MRYPRSSTVGRVGFGLAAAIAVLAFAVRFPGGRAEAKAPPVAPAPETIDLFNGKDLDGWEGHSKYWSVVDGAIVGKNTEKVPVSTYLVTKKKYSDFRLTARVK